MIENPDRLRVIRDLPQLIAYLRDDLGWPVESDQLDETTFNWSPDELRVSEEGRERFRHGIVRQLQPLAPGQPWGVFLVEFTDGRIYRTALREVLRGLVPKRRRNPNLPAWQHENLLFLCTTADYDRFTFVHFRGEKAEKARLASFGWETGSNYLRTLCEFNLPCLRWPDDPADSAAWQKQWTSAFDKEPLTKEFFKRFDQCLERVQSDLQKHQQLSSAEAYSRGQMLLERLLFLYFLQNRGWLNQQRRYLVENFAPHAERPKEFTYYADFLEQLFWTLATAPGGRWRLDGIPFLNGGLFDDDEFAPEDRRKKQNPPLKVRNDTFAFVFDHLLEAFNFTVREDTPLNQDVAVDPEMLGKVFESIVLHAEAADPDAVAPDKRKATGSYYTPRIVVHFICREALRQYLLTHAGDVPDHERKIKAFFAVDATDGLDPEELAGLKQCFKPADGRRIADILADIKACDPAVGSGAFPVGLLHELVNLRRVAETVANGFVDPVRQKGHQWIHDTKAAIVAEGLYGVDIQQQAIEICRLRLWLSLIVDYDLGLDPFVADVQQFRQAIGRISQLPNLEMNFRRGDSLLDIISGEVVRVAPEHSHQYRKEYERIHKLNLHLHNARKSDRKRRLRVEILAERLVLTERVLSDELKQLQTQDSVLAADWFGGSVSDAEKRRKIATEVERIEKALAKVQTDRKALGKLASQPMAGDFNPRLRKLEGADFDSPFNFAWRLDFADILGPRPTARTATVGGEFGIVNAAQDQQELATKIEGRGGFDLILGNPPFVTARNPVKRELYRERWKRVCSGKYLLVCPFFDLSFGLLRPGGELGFIVSNAFAKREFGKPLVEDFFPTVDLQKVVDCSGLLFPGHGTPTFIVLGRNRKPDDKTPIRITATLPGGGDLRSAPEESPLWQAIAAHQDNPGYADNRITVADRSRKGMAKWPWNLESAAEQTRQMMGQERRRLADLVLSVGPSTLTRSDEVFMQPADVLRRFCIEREQVRTVLVGDSLRNWSEASPDTLIFPYRCDYSRLRQADAPRTFAFLKPYRDALENVIVFGRPKKDTDNEWWEYTDPYPDKNTPPTFIAFPEIVTHGHFMFNKKDRKFPQTAPVVRCSQDWKDGDHHLLAGLLNSSVSLFWLKQVCFNKGAGEDEERDRFVYAGGKVEQLPVPESIAETLRGKRNVLADRLSALSRACWDRGRQMPALAMKKLFEKPGEAYQEWNASLSGYVAPAVECGKPFADLASLRENMDRVIARREQLRADMIALQEEMDWLVYAAYGLIGNDECRMINDELPEPLAREQRPFVLSQRAGGDFDKAVALIPAPWAKDRKALWRARLEAIRDNEHIRRIEAPVYKRRWDEQWKVGNSWQCGPVAYDAELVEAFDWWLSEKAEWWLEKEWHGRLARANTGGTPVPLPTWTDALWADTRVQATWEVVREALGRLGRSADFRRYFSALVKAQTVPDNIPWAVPWEKLEKTQKVPASAKRIRGKLNVPRERFRSTPEGLFVWAGSSLEE